MKILFDNTSNIRLSWAPHGIVACIVIFFASVVTVYSIFEFRNKRARQGKRQKVQALQEFRQGRFMRRGGKNAAGRCAPMS